MKQITLTRGKVALVDDEDFEWLSQYKWHFTLGHRGNEYAHTTIYKGKDNPYYRWPMHRAILERQGYDMTGHHADHINGNGLDNRRCNLRKATPQQNACNQRNRRQTNTPYIGVHKYDTERRPSYQAKPYWAAVTVHGKKISAGYFATAEEAAIERDRAAYFYQGEFAVLNFPENLADYKANPFVKRTYGGKIADGRPGPDSGA